MNMLKKKEHYLPLLRRIIMSITICLSSVGISFANIEANSDDDSQITKISQDNLLKGTVLDEKGEPLIGASVVVKGESSGTVTGIGGTFSLIVSPEATLEVSYIGYTTQEVRVNGQTNVEIVLKEDTQSLEELVVVGYGVQKKVNLSGSVSNIKIDELLESRPVSNISQGLAGLAAGVQVTSNSNRPGENNASIIVRGQGTLNNSAPLIIIDGVESNINSINPQDIENISVLKDAASAAIYGSRAANGVILITTRKGKKGSMRVDYNGYVSWESISNKFDLVSNYADYMELINEGYLNSNLAAKFSTNKINEWRNDGGANPLKYPNTDLMNALFETNVGMNHNLSLSGGTDKIRFYTSFGFLNSPGIMENVAYKRYSMRTNIEADIQPWLTVGTNLSGYLGQTESGSNIADNNDAASIFTFSTATTPGMVFKAPDGRFGGINNTEDSAQSADNNPLYRLNYKKATNESRNLKNRFYGTLKPIEGLTLTGSFNYTFLDKILDQQPIFVPLWNFYNETMTSTGVKKTSIMNSDYKRNSYLADVVAVYSNKVSKLNYTVMTGASQELFRYKWFKTTREDLLDVNLGAINGATGPSSSEGNTVEWAMRSYFGRLNLNWNEKYLLEFNMRADGSSRFRPENRWGYFPSASAAWRIDQESFAQNLIDKGLNNLKLRLSYGALGNNALDNGDANTNGNYLAQSLYSASNYILNNGIAMGIAQKVISNSNLTWEKTVISDLGIDFGLANNKLTGAVDYFYKKTENILIDLPIPLVNGNATPPRQNAGTVVNKGVEITLSWQNGIQDFKYFANVNLTFLKNTVTNFKGDVMSLSGANMIKEGSAINTQYGYVVDRLIQNQSDLVYVQNFIDNSPSNNPFGSLKQPQLGDLMYKDMNNDGIINDEDRTVIGHGPTPKFTFGINLGASYKGIDFSTLIQGAQGMEQYLLDDYYRPMVRHGYQLNKIIVDGRWYDGRENNATYPRLLEYSDTRNTIVSSFWIQNKSYIKIKNIQLGYTLPKSLLTDTTIGDVINKIRLYGSLENYFSFTSYKGLDPEVNGFAYPTSKQAVIGINVSF